MPAQKMIFHVPYPLNPQATAASGIRPVRMRAAFEAIGYEVTEVSGSAAERRRQIREVKRRIRGGEQFDLLYSEASTKPTAMTEPHSLPIHPFLDLNFLGYCTQYGIPVGLFYRDIYWNEPAYLDSVHPAIAIATRALYRWDLKRYRTVVKRVFVPSLNMAKVMPHTRFEQCVPLPPGTELVSSPQPDNLTSMFYVGALGKYYRLHEAVRAAANTVGAELTICTSEQLWQAERAEYELTGDLTHTRVVHTSGAGLEPYYAQSALGCLFMEPIGYREFAAPMKLYEYLGHGKPIIVTEGSLAAEFVAERGVGWVLPYESDALVEQLQCLREQPEEFERVLARVLEERELHTWEARARQAVVALFG